MTPSLARDTTPAERCRGARARRSHPPSGAARVRSPSTPSTPDALVLGPQHAESAREVAAAVARAARGWGTSSPCGSSVGLGLLHRIAPARHTQSRTTAQRLNRPQAAWAAAAAGGSHRTNVDGQPRDALAISARRHARRASGSATPNPTRTRTHAPIEARCGGRGSLSPARVPNWPPFQLSCAAGSTDNARAVCARRGACPSPN